MHCSCMPGHTGKIAPSMADGNWLCKQRTPCALTISFSIAAAQITCTCTAHLHDPVLYLGLGRYAWHFHMLRLMLAAPIARPKLAALIGSPCVQIAAACCCKTAHEQRHLENDCQTSPHCLLCQRESWQATYWPAQ